MVKLSVMLQKEMTRGVRNNNPGNIRRGSSWKGLAHRRYGKNDELYVCVSSCNLKQNCVPWDKDFCQFESIFWGIRAFLIVLRTYITKHDVRSIRSFVARYAPSSDGNNEYNYRVFLVSSINKALHLGIHERDCIFTSDPKKVFRNDNEVLYHFCKAVFSLESNFELDYNLFIIALGLL